MLQTRDLIWALLFFGTAASLQVDIIPTQGEISVGESKFFLCTVTGEAKDIDWFSPSGEKIVPNRQDISVIRNDEASSTLTIYNANIDNAGIYKCIAKNGEKESQATVNVKIFQKLTFKNAPSPQEFNEGDDANIVCDVVSSPPPTIIWKHKSVKIQVEKDVRFKVLSNNHLQIRGIKKTDEGVYTCEGRIMARGEIDFRNINVVINVLPTIRTRQLELNATADIGQSVMLACDADGYPEPTVTWARNNIVLEDGDKYSFNEDGSEMTIKDVKKLDQGDYTCIAKNKAGEKDQEISLNVFVKPKITFSENRSATELDEQVVLTCEATGDPIPNILWSFGRRVFTEGEQEPLNRIYQSLDSHVVVRSDNRVSSLTLKYVQFTDAGQYLCTARSSIGVDTQTLYLEVNYAPKIQGSVTVYTWEGNPANITCEVLAHPSASVVWFRDGQQLPSSNTTNVKIYNTPSISLLEITPESQNDFGSYNCTATNSIATESKEFLLIQAEVPSIPIINDVAPYSSTAQIDFEEPDASGGVPILKYKAEWRILGHTEWLQREYDARDAYGENVITISGLKPETVYEVKMSAINGKGEGDSCQPYTFKTEPVQYSYSMTSKSPLVEGNRHIYPQVNQLKKKFKAPHLSSLTSAYYFGGRLLLSVNRDEASQEDEQDGLAVATPISPKDDSSTGTTETPTVVHPPSVPVPTESTEEEEELEWEATEPPSEEIQATKEVLDVLTTTETVEEGQTDAALLAAATGSEEEVTTQTPGAESAGGTVTPPAAELKEEVTTETPSEESVEDTMSPPAAGSEEVTTETPSEESVEDTMTPPAAWSEEEVTTEMPIEESVDGTTIPPAAVSEEKVTTETPGKESAEGTTIPPFPGQTELFTGEVFRARPTELFVEESTRAEEMEVATVVQGTDRPAEEMTVVSLVALPETESPETLPTPEPLQTVSTETDGGLVAFIATLPSDSSHTEETSDKDQEDSTVVTVIPISEETTAGTEVPLLVRYVTKVTEMVAEKDIDKASTEAAAGWVETITAKGKGGTKHTTTASDNKELVFPSWDASTQIAAEKAEIWILEMLKTTSLVEGQTTTLTENIPSLISEQTTASDVYTILAIHTVPGTTKVDTTTTISVTTEKLLTNSVSAETTTYLKGPVTQTLRDTVPSVTPTPISSSSTVLSADSEYPISACSVPFNSLPA
ncbi:neural cell adhesion molecule 1a isoform X2 [Amia ocellicauda]|uniref:neural cell adhesion molecule 1a isoform X2 n=1 Tax=Amia ocellicauda TaxID=2972642 RepID=UPI0034638D64